MSNISQLKQAIRSARGKFYLASQQTSLPIGLFGKNQATQKQKAEEIRFTLKNLLGFEAESRVKLSQMLDALHGELEFGRRYPVMSVEPLTWRSDSGWPVFALFRVDGSGKMTLSTKSGRNYLEPACSDEIKALYCDVFEKLREDARRNGWSGAEISSKLSDLLVPTSTRQKIIEARPTFGREIYLLAETPDWHLEQVDPDPLVLGWKYNQFWLVDVFDLTPLEEFVWCEFTGGDKRGL